MSRPPERQPDRKTMHNKTVEACVEELCQQGCREVRRVIAVLEKGGDVSQALELTVAERSAVLSELRAVMAVYDARSGCDGKDG